MDSTLQVLAAQVQHNHPQLVSTLVEIG
jgi:hypothetical protein